MLRRFQLVAFVLALTLGFGVVATAETVEPLAVVGSEEAPIETAACELESLLTEATQVASCETNCFTQLRICFDRCLPASNCGATCYPPFDFCLSFC